MSEEQGTGWIDRYMQLNRVLRAIVHRGWDFIQE
jgi:hypothetical protein